MVMLRDLQWMGHLPGLVRSRLEWDRVPLLPSQGGSELQLVLKDKCAELRSEDSL